MNKIFKIFLIMGIIFNHSARKQDNDYESFDFGNERYQYSSDLGFLKGTIAKKINFKSISKEEFDQAKARRRA